MGPENQMDNESGKDIIQYFSSDNYMLLQILIWHNSLLCLKLHLIYI